MNPQTQRAVAERHRRKHGQRTLDLPSWLVEELKSEAARLDRSLSSVVQMAWRISRGQSPDRPRVVKPWEVIADELEDRLNYPYKRNSAARSWLRFEAWCAEERLVACPTRKETLLAYLEACIADGVGRNELLRAAAAVASVHHTRGRAPPRLRPSAAAVVDELLASARKARSK